jgi:hypothetical protein
MPPETVTEEEKEFTVTNEDGSVSTVKGRVVTTDHGVTDEFGNPKISVNINVPVATGRTPEEVEADRLKELFKEGV